MTEVRPNCPIHRKSDVSAVGSYGPAGTKRWQCVPRDDARPHVFRPRPKPSPVLANVPSAFGEFGFRYATSMVTASIMRIAEARLEADLLAIEGRSGIMGPAMRKYDGRSPEENQEHFDDWDWDALGEEWSASDEWCTSIVNDLIAPNASKSTASVEIGCGAGRWTIELAPRTKRLDAFDVSAKALARCEARLPDDTNAKLHLVSAPILDGVPDLSVDFVWSFDAFVHMSPNVVAGYLSEIGRVLALDGTAIIHHSGSERPTDIGWRAPMTALLFRNLARSNGLIVVDQFDSWAGGQHWVQNPTDVISVLRRS